MDQLQFHGITRLLIVSLPAFLLGVGLFLLMPWLVGRTIEPAKPAATAPIVMKKSAPREQQAVNSPVTPPPLPKLQLPGLKTDTVDLATTSLTTPHLVLPATPGGSGLALPALPQPGLPPAELAPATGLIPLVRTEPQYPMLARRRRIQGWVELEFVITPQGSVRDIHVIAAQPNGVFDQAAIRALSRWRFQPQQVGGQAVARKARQKLEFKLE